MAVPKLKKAQGNNLSDTLSAGINNTDLTIPVNNSSIWSSNGGKIIIDRGNAAQEIVYCSGKSGSNLVVPASGRGQESTSAVAHNVGATVESVPTAGDWNDVIDTISAEHNDAGTHKKVTGMDNNTPVSMKDSGGTARDLVNITGADIVQLGSTALVKYPQVSENGTMRNIMATNANNIFTQSGTVTTDTSWSNDPNTQVYFNDVTVTFSVAFKAATTPVVVATATNSALNTGVFCMVTSISNTSVVIRVNITHFDPTTNAQLVQWIAMGEI